MSKKQFWILFTMIYLGIGSLHAFKFEDVFHEKYPLKTESLDARIRIMSVGLWPALDVGYIITGFPFSWNPSAH